MSDKKFILGLDIGYGNTKMAFGEQGQKPQIKCYPSGAAKVLPNKNEDVKDGWFCEIDGQKWIAGVEPASLQNPSKILTLSYPTSAHYKALFFSALANTQRTTIDTVVTGLPVNQYFSTVKNADGLTPKEQLIKNMTGTFNIGNGKTVTVKEVKVYPQPIGAYVNYRVHCSDVERAVLQNCHTLVIDVGFYSFDYCFVSFGKLNKDFSGNTAFGVSKIVDQIRDEISKKNGGYKVNISVIERVLRKNEKQIMINEKFEDVQQYIDIASRKVADEALQPMINGLNTENDSIKVIFVGGGAKYFKNILAQDFHEEIPNFDPSKVKDNTVTDNAVGFFYAGQ